MEFWVLDTICLGHCACLFAMFYENWFKVNACVGSFMFVCVVYQKYNTIVI